MSGRIRARFLPKSPRLFPGIWRYGCPRHQRYGGYRFSHYLKLVISLNIIILLMGSWFIPKLWPF
jgi:hypothetical protein